MHVCLHTYIWILTSIHMYTHMHIYDAFTHTYMQIHGCLLTYIYMYIPTYSSMSAKIWMSEHTYIHMHTPKCLPTYIHIQYHNSISILEWNLIMLV